MKPTLARDMRVHDQLSQREAPKLATSGGIKIDKGVPLPVRSGGQPLYPFKDMEIGDSFAIPVPLGEEPRKVSLRIRDAISHWRRYHPEPPFFGAVRIVDDGRAVRCWRVAAPENQARKA